MSPAFRPRWARPEDAPAILAFNRRLADTAPYFLAYDIDPATGADMLGAKLTGGGLSADGDGVLVLADEATDRLAGVLLLRRHRHPAFQGVLQLGLGIAPDWRGMGVGRRFLDHAVDEARAAGVRRLQLATVADNVPAVRLFRAAGFREEGRLSQAAEIDGAFVDVLVMAMAL